MIWALAIFVVVHDEFGALAMFDSDESGEGDALALFVADVEEADVVEAGAVFILGFDVDLPLAARSG